MTPSRSRGEKQPGGAVFVALRRAATVGAVLAVLGSAKVAVAPENSPSFVDQKFARATEEVAFINLEKARFLFAEARAMTKPGSPQWDRAIFGEATCIWHLLPIQRENAAQAAELFTLLASQSPTGTFTPRALLNLGRILELPEDRDDPIDLPGARAWYQKVIDGWPGEPIAGEATLRLSGTYIQTFDHAQVEKGVGLLRAWVEAHPADPLASIMWQYLADTYFFPLRDYRRAFHAYDTVDALGWTEKGLQGPAYWRVAQMSERLLKNREAAVKYYTKIINETPNSGKAYESQLALRRLGAPVPEPARMNFLGAPGGSGAVPAGGKVP
jgi:tetratricopeptide (TPR) repeat protein